MLRYRRKISISQLCPDRPKGRSFFIQMNNVKDSLAHQRAVLGYEHKDGERSKLICRFVHSHVGI